MNRHARLGILALCALAALFAASSFGNAQTPGETKYRYDAAGRLVGVDFPDGRSLVYEYDAAGNLLKRKIAGGPDTPWHFSVKKPGPGAWCLEVDAGGSVSGHGADATRGFYEVEGTITLEKRDVTGTIRFVKVGGGATLATFVLEKSKVKRDKKTDEPVKLVLKARQGIGSALLKATGTIPGPYFEPFLGKYAGDKSQIKVGKDKNPVGSTTFTDGGLDGLSSFAGGITGRLLRDPKGKAYGTMDWGGTTYLVSGKLKDGVKSVKAKGTAPIKVKLTLKQ